MFWKKWIENAPDERPNDSDVAAWLPRLTAVSGYERQEAIDMLGRLRAPAALPALVTRVNDWVPQVRDAAIRAVRGYLTDEHVDAWPAALPALIRLVNARRADHGPLLTEVSQFLADERRMPAVRAATREASRFVARWVADLEWSCASDGERQKAVLSDGIQSPDIVIAMAAVKRLPLMKDQDARQALTRTACEARLPAVRAEALRQWLTLPVEATPMIEAKCFDRTSGVRMVALSALKRTGQPEAVVATAKAQLAAPFRAPHQGLPALAIVLALAYPAMHALTETLATAAPARLRRAALQFQISVSRGGVQEFWLLTALRDPSAIAQRAAVEAIQRGALSPEPGDVWHIALSHGGIGPIRRALAIQRHWGLWRRFEWLLRMAGTALPDGAAGLLIEAFEAWSHIPHGPAPTAAEAAELPGMWAQRRALLPPALGRRIDAQLVDLKLKT